MSIAGQINSSGLAPAQPVSSSESIFRSASENYDKASKIHSRVLAIRDRLYSTVDAKTAGGSAGRPIASGFVGQMQCVNSDMRDMLGYIEVVLGEIENF